MILRQRVGYYIIMLYEPFLYNLGADRGEGLKHIFTSMLIDYLSKQTFFTFQIFYWKFKNCSRDYQKSTRVPYCCSESLTVLCSSHSPYGTLLLLLKLISIKYNSDHFFLSLQWLHFCRQWVNFLSLCPMSCIRVEGWTKEIFSEYFLYWSLCSGLIYL